MKGRQVPIGQILASRSSRSSNSSSTSNSLDAAIAALERELGTGSSNDDDDDDNGDDDEDDNTDDEVDYEGKSVVEKSEDGQPIKIVSKSLLKHRIAPLPSFLLPSATCGKSSHGAGADRRPGALSSKVKFAGDEGASASKRPKNGDAAMSGAEKTIREMLRKYKPNTDRKPFWCRVCQFQGQDESTLLEHRETEYHKMAAAIEMKMCYCKLCRKQFTSMEQLKEHLGGKLHKETLREKNKG